jgi:ankyrin repeat protein
VACGDKTVSGNDFYNELMSLSSWQLSLQKILRKCRPAIQLMNQSTTNLGARSLPILELLESFRSWDATKPADKLFALLAFSSDTSQVPELQPDYTVPKHILSHRIVQFAFPSCVIDRQSAAKTEVIFEVEGLLLGDIRCKWRDRERDFEFSAGESELPMAVLNPKVAELFGRDAGWHIRILNERRLELNSSVVLLRGASRPTVLRFREGKFVVDMLATPEPTKKGERRWDRVRAWSSALEALSAETGGLMKFKLAWDPFRQPYPSEISRYTATVNDVTIQWEANIQSIKDEVENGGENDHNCRTMSMLSIMYRQDKEAIKRGNSKFTMTLHKAAYNGYYGTVKLLLDSNAEVDATLEDFGTALHLAAFRGHANIVRALLDAHATVNCVDGTGRTPLEIALSEGHIEVGRLLLEAGAVPRLRSSEERPDMQIIDFALEGNADGVRELLKAGFDPNQDKDIAGIGRVTGLHIAAEMGHKEVVAVFLEAGATVDALTTTRTTPLHQASMNGHTEVVKLLLQAGADVNAQDDQGATPLDFALYRGKLGTAQVITSAGGWIFKFQGQRQEK